MSEEADGAKEGTSALIILSPEAEEIEVGGKKVMVAPLKVGKLGKFSKAVQTVLPIITASFKDGGEINWMTLIADSSDDLIDAVAIGCNESVEFVSELDTMEFIKLAGKVMVVNVDFFARRLPQITEIVFQSLVKVIPEEMAKKMMDGQTPSNG